MPVKDIRSKRSRVHVEVCRVSTRLILSLFPCYISSLLFTSLSSTCTFPFRPRPRKKKDWWKGKGWRSGEGGRGDGKRFEKHREPPHSSFTFETLPLESFDGLANGTFIPRSPVMLDGMKLSANFSITPPLLPSPLSFHSRSITHRSLLSDQIEHTRFYPSRCNNSSFVSTKLTIKRVKKEREKMEKSGRMRHASIRAISSNSFPPRMPRITPWNAILCFVLAIVFFFFFLSAAIGTVHVGQ